MSNIIFDIETTGLNPALNKIVALGYKLDEQSIIVLKGEENKILNNFFNNLKHQKDVCLIGFSISFDITFIRVRAILNKIRPPDFDSIKNIDLRRVLIGDSKIHGRLGDYGKALGIEKYKGMNGEMVPRLFEKGDIKSIKEYCETDVKITTLLYNRLKELGLV